MKKLIIFPVLFSILSVFAFRQELSQNFADFDKYFLDETMRIDYHHVGNAVEEIITMDQIYKYGIWAGSRKSLIDNLNLGRYCVKIYDADPTN